MRGKRSAAAVAMAGLALVGCYGSTEPATEVERDSARLNARGTANNGPASSVFEYWPAGRQDAARQTRRLNWPGGASGPDRIHGQCAAAQHRVLLSALRRRPGRKRRLRSDAVVHNQSLDR